MTRRLLLIDANLYASRMYYEMTRVDNITCLDQLDSEIKKHIFATIEKHKPTHLVCVFDVDRSAYRTAIYPHYKKNRKCNPEREMFIRYFKTIIEELGICHIGVSCVEADDVIATIVHKRTEIFGENIPTVIESSDKDFRQLLSPSCHLFIPEKKWLLSDRAFINYYHFTPNLFPLFLALFGDTSDNISPALIKSPLESKYEHLKGIADIVRRCKNRENILDWAWDHYGINQNARKIVNAAHKFDRNIKLVTLLNDVDLSGLQADAMVANYLLQ